MKILSILAQKPSSTGSGIYLTEVLKSLRKMGEEQAVVYGITKEDKVPEFSGVKAYPVYYESADLPFPVLGMSDEMPPICFFKESLGSGTGISTRSRALPSPLSSYGLGSRSFSGSYYIRFLS